VLGRLLFSEQGTGMNPSVERTYFVIEIKQHKSGTLVPGLAEVKGHH